MKRLARVTGRIVVLASMLGGTVGVGLLHSPALAADAGLSWTKPGILVTDTASGSQLRSATAADGTTLATWNESRHLRMAIRLPGSSAWTSLSNPDGLDSMYAAAEVVATPDGDFWIAMQSMSPEAYVARLDTDDLSWSTPEPIFAATTSSVDNYVQLGIDASGTVTVAALTAYSSLLVATKIAENPWSVSIIADIVSTSQAPSLAVGPDGQAVLAWNQFDFVNRDNAFVVASRSSATAAWQLHTLADSVPRLGPMESVRMLDFITAVGSDGTAAVAWLTPFTYDIKTLTVATADITTDSPVWTAQDVAEDNTDDILSPRLEVSPAGVTHLVWVQDGENGPDERIVKHTTIDASTPTTPVTINDSSYQIATIADTMIDDDGALEVLYSTSLRAASWGLRLVTVDAAGAVATATISSLNDDYITSHVAFGQTYLSGVIGQDGTGRRTIVWGQADGDIVQNRENASPTAGFTADCTGHTCTFDASPSTDDDGLSAYSWDFGDDMAGTGASPSHTYDDRSAHAVALTVTDTDSATARSTSTVALPANVAPTASFSFSCDELTCSFDARLSADDDELSTFSWDFGDSTSDTGGAVLSHVFAAAGTRNVTLTVTDADGVQDVEELQVSVSAPPAVAGITYVDSRAKVSDSRTARVRVPAAVEDGNRLILVLSTNRGMPVVSNPTGWTRLGTVQAKSMKTVAWASSASASSAGTQVLVGLAQRAKSTLMVSAYAGDDATTWPAIRLGKDLTTTQARSTLNANVSAGSWVLSYWADKSTDTTAWTPDDTTTRQATCGTGSNHVCALLTDSARPTAAGVYGGIAAQTDAPSSLATLLTIVLRPAA
jgi:PKD repeat protein